MNRFSSTDPLGVRQHDPLEKWRAEVERDERERERERRREEHRQRRNALTNEAAERRALEARIAELEAAHRELQGQIVDITRATSDAIDGLCDCRDEIEREFKAAIVKIEAKITDMYEKGAEEARKTYQFARERIGELTDLPNSMAPPQRVN
jgi:hypothetical protein